MPVILPARSEYSLAGKRPERVNSSRLPCNSLAISAERCSPVPAEAEVAPTAPGGADAVERIQLGGGAGSSPGDGALRKEPAACRPIECLPRRLGTLVSGTTRASGSGFVPDEPALLLLVREGTLRSGIGGDLPWAWVLAFFRSCALALVIVGGLERWPLLPISRRCVCVGRRKSVSLTRPLCCRESVCVRVLHSLSAVAPSRICICKSFGPQSPTGILCSCRPHTRHSRHTFLILGSRVDGHFWHVWESGAL